MLADMGEVWTDLAERPIGAGNDMAAAAAVASDCGATPILVAADDHLGASGAAPVSAHRSRHP